MGRSPHVTLNGSATQRAPDRRSDSLLLWIGAITILAAALRLHQLGEGSFWLDELFTIHSASHLDETHRSRTLGFIPTAIGLRAAGVDMDAIHIERTHEWRALGVTEMTARLPSALIGILSVPLIGLVACRMLGTRAGLLAAFFLAIAPWHIYWSQAARFYVPQFLFATLCLGLYYIATRDGSRRCFAASMACFVVAFACQPTALVLLGVFGADWIVARWRGEPIALGAFEWGAGVVAAGLCLAILSLDVSAAPSDWTHFVLEPLRHQAPIPFIFGALYLIGPVVAVFAGLSALATRSERLTTYLLAAAVIPIVVFAATSSFAFVGLRYSFVCLFGWLALAAIGADRMARGCGPRASAVLTWAPPALLMIAMMKTNYVYFNSHGNFHARWRDAVRLVQERRAAGEPVVASDPVIASYYLAEPVDPIPNSREALARLAAPTWFVVESTHPALRTSRFWLLDQAELVDFFNLRAVHSDSSVQVYRFKGAETHDRDE